MIEHNRLVKLVKEGALEDKTSIGIVGKLAELVTGIDRIGGII